MEELVLIPHKETMGGYVQRYERLAKNCKETRRGVLTEIKEWELLEQTGLSEIEIQVVLGVYNTEDMKR